MSTPMTVEITFLDTDLTVHGWYTPETPGKTSGPAENCYEGEPSEFEIEDILIEGTSVYEMMQCCAIAQNTKPISHRDFVEELAEACCEQLDEAEPSDDCDPPEPSYDD